MSARSSSLSMGALSWLWLGGVQAASLLRSGRPPFLLFGEFA